MSTNSIVAAHQRLAEALDELRATRGAGASDTELFSVLTVCEGVVRRLDAITVGAVATLTRRGAFAERGYKSASMVVKNLLGCEQGEARRRVAAADQVSPRVGLDGTVLPPRLPATQQYSPPDRPACAELRR